MKTRHWAVILLGVVAASAPIRASRAQTPATAAGGLTSLQAIEAEFQRDLVKIERMRIERLATLAASQPKAEAAKTYEELFRFVIAVGLYTEAEPIAERVLGSGEATPEVAILAEMINIVAEANRGAYEDSLKSLATAIQIGKQEAQVDPKNAAKVRVAIPLVAKLSLLSVYTQRLIQSGQYDIARKAMTMIRDSTVEAAIKKLAVSRLALLDLIGKPAPPIVGTSLDGKPVSLEDYKGDVVFVVFWASWCLQNGQDAATFNETAAQFREKGLRVIGINLDSLQDGGVPVESVMPNVRRFLVEYNVRWPNLINGSGDKDYAKTYGITEVPTNLLIGRDGKVLHLDLNRGNLVEVVTKALAR
jgi:thiol-disulfide isomerase/thioredoxin